MSSALFGFAMGMMTAGIFARALSAWLTWKEKKPEQVDLSGLGHEFVTRAAREDLFTCKVCGRPLGDHTSDPEVKINV